jgi:ABC-type branched-subunit amino acid transport system ATPase component
MDAPQASPILEVLDVRLSFHGVNALAGASFPVARSSLTALIGPNGAGKTTLFNVISGLVRPDSGTIRFNGRNLVGLKPESIARRGLARTFQIARGLPRLSVYEHLMLAGRSQPGESFVRGILGDPRVRQAERDLDARARNVAWRLRLDGVLDHPAHGLSGGQKKLLEIGRALMAEARMILLDEPVAGVNPTLANEITEQLRALAREDVTILLIEHDMAMVAKLCDHVVAMADGIVLARGTYEEVARNEKVREAYLGVRG